MAETIVVVEPNDPTGVEVLSVTMGTMGPAGPAGPPGETGPPGSTGPAGPTGPMPVITGTTTSSLTQGTGSRTLTISNPSATSFAAGQYVRIARAGANSATYMAGNVTAYNSSTGAMTVNVVEASGTGTFTDYVVTISGVQGVQGPAGANGTNGTTPTISSTSAATFVPSLGSKDFTGVATGVATFTVGNYVRISSRSAPADYMAGFITAYSGTTLTVNVLEFAGTTSRSDWNINVSGQKGEDGTGGTGSGLPTGGTREQILVHNGTEAVWRTSVPPHHFSPGSPGAQGRQWIRLLTIDGVSATAGASWSGILAGTGDYGDTDCATTFLHVGQRGDNNIAVKAWSLDYENTTDAPVFHTRQVSTYVFELWAQLSDFNFAHGLHTLHSSNFTNVTINRDQLSTLAPAGLSASIGVVSLSEAATRVASATASAVPSSLPLRDSAGSIGFTQVLLANAASGASEAVRRQEHDAAIATRAARQLTKRTITGSYTLVAADATDIMLHVTATSGITITLPADTVAIGQEIAIPGRQYGAGQITFVAGTGATLLTRGGANKTAGQNAPFTLEKTAANTWLVSGDLTA